MSIFNIFNKPLPPPPPPEPIYKRQPIATTAVILTIIGMFVLGPVGMLWNGMAEELKKKADNATVIMLMQQQKENDDRQWEEIKNNRNQQPRMAGSVIAPTSKKAKLTPEQFEKYMSLSPEIRTKYKKYLESQGYDCEGLPE